MKAIQQLLRQPLKTLSGLILITLAVAILCVCLGQTLTAANMKNSMEQLCTSVALPTERYLTGGYYDPKYGMVYQFTTDMPDSVVQWMYDMAQQYPEIVEGVNRPGLISAYIPELTADNYTSYFVDMTGSEPFSAVVTTDPNSTGYAHAMLEITLEAVGDVMPYSASKYHSPVEGISLELTGTIENVLGLQSGYTDPTGYTARLTLVLPDAEALQALELEVGQRYLVYGMDYTDLDQQLRGDIAVYGYGLSKAGSAQSEHPKVDYFYEENWVPYTEEYIEGMGWAELAEYKAGWYEFEQTFSDGRTELRGIHLTNLDLLKFRSVAFTLLDLSQLKAGISDTYTVPTIAKLDGTAEDFLSRAEGELWRKYLELTCIGHRSFPVLGVDDLMATGDFALEETAITSGRNFTPEELSQGAKVCVISQEVAALSGLKVGDSITMNFYLQDPCDPYQDLISQGYGTANPAAYPYRGAEEFDAGREEYTIVGLYTREFAWEGATSAYNFTVNTVFVPKTSVAAEMQYGEIGVFLSMVICNGRLDDFEALAARDGHDGLFLTTDQGYAQVVNNLHDYEKIARQAAVVGAAVYGVIMVLYLLLYPAMQAKTLKTMGSLGAGSGEKLGFMMATSLSMLALGTLLGAALGMLLWDEATNALIQSARVTLQLELQLGTLMAIAGGQLLLAAAAALVISLPMCRNNRLLERQSLVKKLSQKLRRTPLAGWSVVAFAAVIALVLCALQDANEEEYANYQAAVQEAPVTVTLVSPVTNDPYHLGAQGFVMDLFYEERYSRFTPLQYLKDLQYMTSLTVDAINFWSAEHMIQCVDSADNLPEDVEITWFDGYDESLFNTDTLFVLVPQTLALRDSSQSMEGIQLVLTSGVNFGHVTVAGTYSGGNGTRFYSSRAGMQVFCEKMLVDYSALLKFEVSMFDAQQVSFTGITSKASPPNLTAQRDCVITWLEGYDPSCLDSEEEMFLLAPEAMELIDCDPETPGLQVQLHLEDMVFTGYYGRQDGDLAGQPKYRKMEYDCVATLAGTYTNSIDSRDVYCSFAPLLTCGARIGQTPKLDYISATLIHNDARQQLREMCNEWFKDPDDPEMQPKNYKGYALIINDETLENLRLTLENSIAINEICTLLVFMLSAGAGFFLGFLMIRSRKREIILMRTLGRANFSIYLSYALEQMLCILAGTVLGGLVFRWQPVQRLGIFVGIYFVGLSAALLLFLNSKLLTTVKEDE